MCISNSHHMTNTPFCYLPFMLFIIIMALSILFTWNKLFFCTLLELKLENENVYKAIEECELEMCHAMAHTKYSKLSNKQLVTGKKKSQLFLITLDYPNTLCFQWQLMEIFPLFHRRIHRVRRKQKKNIKSSFLQRRTCGWDL